MDFSKRGEAKCPHASCFSGKSLLRSVSAGTRRPGWPLHGKSRPALQENVHNVE